MERRESPSPSHREAGTQDHVQAPPSPSSRVGPLRVGSHSAHVACDSAESRAAFMTAKWKVGLYSLSMHREFSEGHRVVGDV